MTSNGNGNNKSWWLLFYFGMAYFCQHFAQTGLLAQPMQFYFKEVLGFSPSDTATFMASLVFPWMIKPVYGLISDYLPLFGYRRKSYLLILNVAATLAFLALTGLCTTESIRIALLVTAVCTAFSDVAVDGLMVELGRKTGQTANFQSMQWMWMNVAAVLSSLLGGYLINWFGAAGAFHVACGITAAFPLVMIAGTWFLVYEDRVQAGQHYATFFAGLFAGVRSCASYLFGSFKSPALFFSMIVNCLTWPFLTIFGFVRRQLTLIIVAGFIFFWQFSPSFGTPFYYYQTDVLKFSQEFIGQLSAIASVANVLGALAFSRFLSRYTTKTLLYWSAIVGIIGTMCYWVMVDPPFWAWLCSLVGLNPISMPVVAIVLGFVFGIAAMIAMLTILNLAAENCPKRNEALTFALLMSLSNLAVQGSSITGAWLYDRATKGAQEGAFQMVEWIYQHGLSGFFAHFDNAFKPLIIISAIFSALCLPMIRFLPNPQPDNNDEENGGNGNT